MEDYTREEEIAIKNGAILLDDGDGNEYWDIDREIFKDICTAIKKPENDLVGFSDLMKMSNGVVFIEHDIDTCPLYLKLETLDDDILVSSLFQYGDNAPRRFGFREMSEANKNSVEFYVLTDADKLKIINRLANTEMYF